MRTITHPGHAEQPRAVIHACHAEFMKLTLQSGRSVLAAVHEALQEKGYESAVVQVRGGAFSPLVYVIPALSEGRVQAAWYSDIRAPDGRSTNEELCLMFGRRDGEPFLHCHGTWRHADGFRAAGHLMPHDACFAEPVEADVWAISGAILDQLEDPETLFKLFTPVGADSVPSDRSQRAVLCRIKPNEDVSKAIERIAEEHGFESATLHGIGSLVGCDFIDGTHMSSIASELYIRSGKVWKQDGAFQSTLDIAIVDIDGQIFEGVITSGGNNVCVTFELLIVESAA